MTTSATPRLNASVFLSFAAGDRGFASRVSDALSRAGLTVRGTGELGLSGTYSDAVRRNIEKSRAVVVALGEGLGRGDLPASVLFEAGAATGAGKPLFVVVEDARRTLPFNVAGLRVLPFTRVEEISTALNSPEDSRPRAAG